MTLETHACYSFDKNFEVVEVKKKFSLKQTRLLFYLKVRFSKLPKAILAERATFNVLP